MPSFSQKSLDRLWTCDKRLQKVFNEVILHVDCTILEGFRSKSAQDEYYRTRVSQVQWPDSKHNSNPSRAVDAVPYPIDWQDHRRFYLFAGFVKGVALMQGIKIRWGGDWDGDWTWKDQKFHDLPHFELVD